MLLDRLAIPYDAVAPDVDEQPLPGEMPAATALRLAETKARSVAIRQSAALIIGSDQVAVLGNQALGKPGSHEAATRQLLTMSGCKVTFHTALCLLNAGTGHAQIASVPTVVQFRPLHAAQIERYLRHDKPYDCAGSAKVEALGITLLETISSDDPTALIGLPLTVLVSMLGREGITLP